MASREPRKTDAPIIAITGANGFIGRAVRRSLSREKAAVRILDGDVRDSDTFSADFDALVHLAARTPSGAPENPGETVSVNVAGLANALEACRRNSAAIVFASTSGVYAPRAETEPLSETATVEPRWLYPLTKHMGEELCRHYAKVHGVRGTIVRLFNVYGPGQSEYFLIPYLIRAIRGQGEAQVRNRESIRDFIHVDDVAHAIAKAVTRPGAMTALNIGTGKPTRIGDVVQLLRDIAGGEDGVVTQRQDDDDPTPCVFADTRQAESLLGWRPGIDLSTGLKSCLDVD